MVPCNCGTPDATGDQSEWMPRITTLCFLFVFLFSMLTFDKIFTIEEINLAKTKISERNFHQKVEKRRPKFTLILD